jgi:hypothetical protein
VTERELSRGAAHRLAIIRHAQEVTGNVSLTCRYYGISRQAYYKWLRRYEEGTPRRGRPRIAATTEATASAASTSSLCPTTIATWPDPTCGGPECGRSHARRAAVHALGLQGSRSVVVRSVGEELQVVLSPASDLPPQQTMQPLDGRPKCLVQVESPLVHSLALVSDC